MPVTRVAVIGAGVVGSAVARELSLRGAEVTIYEARHPGAGTSTTSFAWTNSSHKTPRAYHDLNAVGIAAHRELQALPHAGEPWFRPTGRLAWEVGEAVSDLRDDVERLTEWGYAARWVSPAEARALEPDLRIPSAVREIAWFPDEGHVLPALFLARLLGEARERGAVLRTGTAVERLESRPGNARLHLADGTVPEVDVVVSCAGRWSSPLLATAGVDVPLQDPDAAGSATVGFLAWTAPLVARLRRIVMAPEITARPDGGGRLVLQRLSEDGAADPANPPAADGEVAERMRAGLAQVLAGAEHARIEQVRVGQRALPADGHTVCGPADPEGHLYVIATHSGVTLSALLGRLAAEEILLQRESALLESFRPGRFAGQALPVLAPARRVGEQ